MAEESTAPEAQDLTEAQVAELNDAFLADLAATLIPMTHPDGGTCDLYKSDKAGNILVPANEAALMQEHGFVVVDAPAPKGA